MVTVYILEFGSHDSPLSFTTISDISKNWAIDELVGFNVVNLNFPYNFGTITSNTSNTAEVAGFWDDGDSYRISRLVNIDENVTSEGDALLYQTNDDGEINYNDGLLEMSGGLATSTYLSLFGGNEEDDGRRLNKKTWWGNIDEIDDASKQISRTQYLLKSIPATSANLKRIEDAASLDLGWMTRTGLATTIDVVVGIPALNRISLTVTIDADGMKPVTYQFIENWRAM